VRRVMVAAVWFVLAAVGQAQAPAAPAPAAPAVRMRWTEAQAKAWYGQQPWLVGANYIPASAINELEMWQADTFDAARIDRELGWAEGIGMNTMRVFLHDLLWQQDAKAFTARTRTRSSGRSMHRRRASTTRAGCRARAPPRSRIAPNGRGSRPT
jgi:hypothetical protein